MTKKIFSRMFIFIFCAIPVISGSGCARRRVPPDSQTLKEQCRGLTAQVKRLRQENDNLKKDISIFKGSGRFLDEGTFSEAAKVFEAAFAEEIAGGLVAIRLEERGLNLSILAEALFVSGSDALSLDGKDLLDRAGLLFVQHFPLQYFFIEGHTDNQSLAILGWKSDWDFSFARALSVYKHLKDKSGINPAQFSISGFGQSRPRGSNETKEGRRLNRRIEIIVSPQRLARLDEGER